MRKSHDKDTWSKRFVKKFEIVVITARKAFIAFKFQQLCRTEDITGIFFFMVLLCAPRLNILSLGVFLKNSCVSFPVLLLVVESIAWPDLFVSWGWGGIVLLFLYIFLSGNLFCGHCRHDEYDPGEPPPSIHFLWAFFTSLCIGPKGTVFLELWFLRAYA